MKTTGSIHWSECPGYGFAIGRLRAQETLLLDRSFYERLIRTEGANEFVSVLSETRYGQFLTADVSVNQGLLLAAGENFSFCQEYAVDRWFQVLLQSIPDIFNLKVFLKRRFLGQPVQDGELLAGGRWDRATLAALVEESGEKPKKAAAGLAPVRRRVLEVLQQARAANDPALIDLALDRFGQELALALTTGKDYAHRYYRLYADVTNVKTALRLRFLEEGEATFRLAFLPGGELDYPRLSWLLKPEEERVPLQVKDERLSFLVQVGTAAGARGSFLPLERRAREILIDYINTARYVALGYEPLFRFYLLRENEIVNLRQLYAAKIAGFGPQECQEVVVYAV